MSRCLEAEIFLRGMHFGQKYIEICWFFGGKVESKEEREMAGIFLDSCVSFQNIKRKHSYRKTHQLRAK